ncbi:MAG TPA: glycosyl hydrolase family 65 protein [Steroidobacteraceae bacterium]|jgi:trehalose/maltose hydrolase-like predicted phosphorylase
MNARVATVVRTGLCALFCVCAISARGENDASFRLSAHFADLPGYFPGYLGNGYISSLSTPRGTEVSPAYVVGLMEYAPGDVSRPAALPGWSELDFSAGPASSDFAWLNRVPLDPQHFSDYQQTLDLYEATLTTRYRYLDRGRETQVEVVSFVSQASPHLAVTRFRITPQFDGLVRLSFALTPCAPHTPRFPLAQLSGPQMEQAVAAKGLSVKPRAPATADRAAIWYPGNLRIESSDANGASLSLWLGGQAQQGLTTAMAAAVSLPKALQPVSVAVHRGGDRLALDVSAKLEHGHTYAFTKYVAISREGWGGSATDDRALAERARDAGFEHLLAKQRGAWHELWRADIQIDGDARAQQTVHSELYYLLASSTADTAWALGACGLTTGYSGHIFWDSDTWIFPALLLLHPERAKSLVTFRERTLGPAEHRAREHGFAGAMYPWESDSENGTEQTPYFAHVLGESEIHVNADVAIAQWQYFLATGDRDWLRLRGWPVIREVAQFWASRASYDPTQHRYELAHVTSVSESHTDITNDTFTNVSAAKALSIALQASRLLGEQADPLWARIAHGLDIPVAPGGKHHLAFEPVVVARRNDPGGGPLALLFLPSLDLRSDPDLLRNDYEYAMGSESLAEVGRFSMGIAPRVIAAAAIARGADAAGWFASNFSGGTLKPPFNVRTETAANDTGYFLTGSGGYIQSIVYGLTGLRIRNNGLIEAYRPVLPNEWSGLTLRNVSFRGRHMDIRIARDRSGLAHLSRDVH